MLSSTLLSECLVTMFCFGDKNPVLNISFRFGRNTGAFFFDANAFSKGDGRWLGYDLNILIAIWF